jgi:phage recombination protein Bet
MSTAVALHSVDREKLDLIKQTVAKGATDLELELFMHACKRTGLDPLMKQIYAIKRWSAADKREVMSFQTGIDGYRLIADRTGQYGGSNEPEYTLGDDGFPDVASVTVIKIVGSLQCKFSASARWHEYCQLNKEGKPTSMWQKMPFLMLGKCAEALALRKAFPAELSGVYTHEEMMQADSEPPPPRQPAPQAKQVEEKRQEDGLEVSYTSATQQVQDAPAPKPAHPLPPAAGPSTYKLKVGRQKGQPITDQADENLDWALNYYQEKIRTTPTSNYVEEWEQAVLEIRAEMLNRYPDAVGENE